MTAAADELVVTQPSVSSAISSLGRELGCELFQRSGRGVALTAAGAAFAPYAADVVGLLSSGRRAAREAGEVEARRLRLIAVTTAAESFVPPLMRAFSDLHPEIELTLDVGNRQTVLARIQNHEADVAILGRPPADERLESLPLVSNEIVCIAAPDDPAVGRTAVRAAELGDRIMAAARARIGHARAQRALPRGAGNRPADADARLQRRDPPGGPGRARRLARLA